MRFDVIDSYQSINGKVLEDVKEFAKQHIEIAKSPL